MFHFCEIIKRHKAILFFRAMCLLIQGLLIGVLTVLSKLTYDLTLAILILVVCLPVVLQTIKLAVL